MIDSVQFFIPLAALIQIVFTGFAGVDALYFHTWRQRLHARPETRREHHLHTLNACLFPFTVWFLFCVNAGGLALWAGIVATVLTFLVEIVDVAHEKTSRKGFGGLGAAEGVMHFGMGVLRALAFAFVLASKPVSAFALTAPLLLPEAYPEWVIWMGRAMFVLAIPMALLHIALGIVGARGGGSHVAH